MRKKEWPGKAGARDRNRTDTPLSGPGILSPVRLPVSPPGRAGKLLKPLYQFSCGGFGLGGDSALSFGISRLLPACAWRVRCLSACSAGGRTGIRLRAGRCSYSQRQMHLRERTLSRAQLISSAEKVANKAGASFLWLVPRHAFGGALGLAISYHSEQFNKVAGHTIKSCSPRPPAAPRWHGDRRHLI
jgi:hypothetical protein